MKVYAVISEIVRTGIGADIMVMYVLLGRSVSTVYMARV
jgi:hypothetical protein